MNGVYTQGDGLDITAGVERVPVTGEWLGPNLHVCYGSTCESVRKWSQMNPGVDPFDEGIFCWGCDECC